jgi:hypothetical protein
MRQSKSDFSARKAQNKGIAHGHTKMGKGGKVMRRYNAKTARWEAVGSARAGMPKRTSQNPKGTMLAQYKAYAAPKSSWGSARTSDAWRKPGGGGLAGPNSPLVNADKRVVASFKGAVSSVPTASSAFKGASKGVSAIKKKTPSSKYFKQGGGGLVGWLRSR